MTDAQPRAAEAQHATAPPAGSAPPLVDPGHPAVEAAGAPAPPTVPLTPLADVIAKPARRSSRSTSLLMVLAGAVAIGGIAFAAGRLTAPATTAAGFPGAGRLPGSGQTGEGQLPGSGQFPADGQGVPGRGGFGGGMSLQGTVTEVTADAITIELASGTTVTIPVDADTTYRSATLATAETVEVGSDVAITPGSRLADPDATLDPNAEPGMAGGVSFGPASEVTVVEP